MVNDIQQFGDLTIEHDEGYQQREWRFQCVGRWLIGIFILLALLGLFGKGGLAGASVEAGQFRVDYERFVRQQTGTRLQLTISSSAASDTFNVTFASDQLADIRITDITPAPLEVASHQDRLEYTFRRTSGESSSINFHYQPQMVGSLTLRLADGAGAALDVSQFVWP